MEELSNYRIPGVNLGYYISEYITTEEEESLIKSVYESPKPKWTNLRNRRLQNWGGLPHPKGMVPDNIPNWLQNIMDRVYKTGASLFAERSPNHVLINEYTIGQGILPHHDGPLYLPVIATLTVGSHAVLNYYNPLEGARATAEERESSSGLPSPSPSASSDSFSFSEEADASSSNAWASRYAGFSLYLEPRSLMLVSGELYAHYLHGIEERTSDTVDARLVNLSLCRGSRGALDSLDGLDAVPPPPATAPAPASSALSSSVTNSIEGGGSSGQLTDALVAARAPAEELTLGAVRQRSTRLSFTIRHVPKVLKSRLFLSRTHK